MQDNKKLKRKVRNSYMISTVSIALVLFLLGSVSYLIYNALDASDRMKESVSVYVMLDDDITPQQKGAVENNLASHEIVRHATYITKDQAAEEFKQYDASDYEEFLDYNPFPAHYDVKLNANGSDIETLVSFEQTALQWAGVEEVVYQRNVISEIGTNLNKFNLILWLFGGALLVISLILLNNTIRITIYSKRYIISTMKLVGATRWFIMKPFLGSSLRQGIYAGLIATVMFVGMVAGLQEGLPEVKFVAGKEELIWIIAGMFATGILISLVFTIFAVKKFIRLPTGAIHYY